MHGASSDYIYYIIMEFFIPNLLFSLWCASVLFYLQCVQFFKANVCSKISIIICMDDVPTYTSMLSINTVINLEWSVDDRARR